MSYNGINRNFPPGHAFRLKRQPFSPNGWLAMKRIIALGLVALFLGTTSPAFASKQDEAVKATQVLKTSKDTAAKIQAAIEIGNIGQIKKSYTTDAIPYL